MESSVTSQSALAMLSWQIELGATETIGDSPINRYDTPPEKPGKAPCSEPASMPAPAIISAADDPVKEAEKAASSCSDLNALQSSMQSFEHCDLKRGARNLVFSDGNPKAWVMIIGEAPGRDEDRIGKPFVGRAGQLLDKMLAAINLSRERQAPETAAYITNVLPWRPPQNRDPKPEEIAMLLPFVQRHVELIDPQVIVLMGNISCQAGLGRRGITRLRGTWTEAYGKPALPMFHPAYLLRSPHAKREAWADLLDLQARLRAST